MIEYNYFKGQKGSFVNIFFFFNPVKTQIELRRRTNVYAQCQISNVNIKILYIPYRAALFIKS